MTRPFKKLLFVNLLLAVQFSQVYAQSGNRPAHYSFRQESMKTILVEIHIPAPTFENNKETGFKKQSSPGEGSFQLDNGALFGFSKMLLLPEGTRVEVVKKGIAESIVTGNLDFSTLQDAPIQKENSHELLKEITISTAKKSFKTNDRFAADESAVELKYLGKMRGAPVSSLVVKPYSFKNNAVHFFRSITVRLVLPEAHSVQEITQSPVSAFSRRSFKKSEKLPNAMLSTTLLKRIPAAPDGFNYKIIIDKEGLVRVTAGELLKAGIPLENINSQTISLWNKGVEIPVYVYDRNNQKLDAGGLTEEYIEFFGEPNRQHFKNRDRDIFGDPETDENVYALTWGDRLGKRMVEESGDIKITDQSRMTDLRGQSFKSTVFAEENLVFDRFGGTAFTKDTNKPGFQGDQHFWQRVNANQTARFPVELPHPDLLDDGDIHITAMMHGATDLLKEFPQCRENNEHNAEIYINQQRALRASWSGIRQFKADEKVHGIDEIPMNAASNAENSVITVSNVFNCTDASGLTPGFYVNWLQVSYQRLYKAFKNSLPFYIPKQGESGLYTFYISDFTRPDILIYRKGISRIINFGTRIIKPDDSFKETSYTLTFQSHVASPDEEFFAISEDQVLKAKALVKDKATSFADAANDFDYIIITDTTLYNPLLKDDAHAENPVLKLKSFKNRAQGFKTLAADINDVADEFNYGVKSKEAIRRFLKHAYSEWKVAPRYAVLAGTVGAIPPDQWQTVRWGTTPTDYTYGLIEGYYRGSNGDVIADVFPEILIGRIPASTKEQLSAIVEKSIAYHENPDLDFYRSSAVLIAGDNSMFEIQSNKLAEVIPASVSVRRVYVRSQSEKYFGGTSSLINEMDKGTAYINYMGHGGGAVWDDKGLLLPADVKRISNRGKYCVVSSPTCFTGAYEGTEGLLTAFIFERERGAIAAWGNSGYGWQENSYYFANGLVESFFLKENRGKNIADLFAEGKARYFSKSGGYDNPIAVSMLLQCNYLGDPALQFGIAKKELDVETDKSFAAAGDNISFKGTALFESGQGVIELFDEQKNTIAGTEQSIAVQGGKFAGFLKVPSNYSGSSIGVRAYANDFTQENEAEGSILLSADSIVFNTVSVQPFPVQPGQPFSFQAKIHSRSAINSVNIIVEIIAPDETIINDTILMPESAGVFKTTGQIPGALALKGSRVSYRFEVNNGNSISASRQYSFVIGGVADPAAYAQTPGDSIQDISGSRAINATIRMYATPQGAQLGAYIYNWGDNDAVDVDVNFENISSKTFLGKTVISIPARSKVLALVPISNTSLQLENIKITINSNNSTNEDLTTGNNTSISSALLSCYMIAPGIGSTNDGITSSAVGVEGSAVLEIFNSGAISKNELVCILADTMKNTVQPGVILLKGNEVSSITVYPENPANDVRGVLKLWYDKYAPEIQNANPAIYKFNPRIQTWSRLPSTVISPGIVTANILLKGTYAVGYSNDMSAPNTRISIEGQFFTNHGAVPPSPKISIVATDENGIHSEPENLVLEIDNKRVLKEDFAFIDSAATATSSGILYKPNLSNGRHTFCISVMDNNGNQSDRDCIQMEVSTEFQVRVLGEFPNPFENEMFLAYDILGANTIDEVEVKFYTSSGRTIRSLRYPSDDPRQWLGLKKEGSSDPTSIGYHEAWWDGTDENGNEVANGVYFYRIRLKSGDETVETLGKIARVR